MPAWRAGKSDPRAYGLGWEERQPVRVRRGQQAHALELPQAHADEGTLHEDVRQLLLCEDERGLAAAGRLEALKHGADGRKRLAAVEEQHGRDHDAKDLDAVAAHPQHEHLHRDALGRVRDDVPRFLWLPTRLFAGAAARPRACAVSPGSPFVAADQRGRVPSGAAGSSPWPFCAPSRCPSSAPPPPRRCPRARA